MQLDIIGQQSVKIEDWNAENNGVGCEQFWIIAELPIILLFVLILPIHPNFYNTGAKIKINQGH